MSDDSVFVHPQAVFDSIRAMQSTLTAVAPPPVPAIPPDFRNATANESLAHLLGAVTSLRAALATQVELAANAVRVVTLGVIRADEVDEE